MYRRSAMALLVAVPVLLVAGCGDDSTDGASSTSWSDGQVREAIALRVGESSADDAKLGDMLRATLKNPSGQDVGEVVFSANPGKSDTVVLARVDLPEGAEGRSYHGMHVHANNDPGNGTDCQADPNAASTTWFQSVDGHLTGAPGATHGDHEGDLPAIYVDAEGKADTTFTTDGVKLSDLKGKAVILHAKGDNFGVVPTGTAPDQYEPNSEAATTLTDKTGNGGDRIACGVISAYEQ